MGDDLPPLPSRPARLVHSNLAHRGTHLFPVWCAMNVYWICDGIPPNTPPCGADGTNEGTGKGSAHKHTVETGHATVAAMLPRVPARLRDLAAKGATA